MIVCKRTFFDCHVVIVCVNSYLILSTCINNFHLHLV
nr:MAG TPA: hypothetical protein [Crassvirales sp.]